MSVHAPRNITEAIHGQAGFIDPPIDALIHVNPAESPPTGWGARNVQQFKSGHTSNLPTNESSEQGYGVGPERKWGHYPHAVNPNGYRNATVLLRNGGDTYRTNVYRPEVVAYWYSALAREQTWAPVKRRQRTGAVQNQAPSAPYVTTIPPLTPGGY